MMRQASRPELSRGQSVFSLKGAPEGLRCSETVKFSQFRDYPGLAGRGDARCHRCEPPLQYVVVNPTAFFERSVKGPTRHAELLAEKFWRKLRLLKMSLHHLFCTSNQDALHLCCNRQHTLLRRSHTCRNDIYRRFTRRRRFLFRHGWQASYQQLEIIAQESPSGLSKVKPMQLVQGAELFSHRIMRDCDARHY